MKNKTVAIVINTSWNIYNFRFELLQSFQNEGYSVIAIAPTDEFSLKLEEMGVEHHNIIINNKGTHPIEDLKLIFSFYRLFKKINPDILFHYTIKPNIYGSIAAWFAGIPVISNISGLGTVFLNNKLSSRVARLLYKLALKIPKKVFFQNPHDQELFINSKLVNKHKTGLLPGSGINANTFIPIESKKTDFFSFLFIARLVKDKGLIEYVEAARLIRKKYPEVRCKVLGPFYPGNPSAISSAEMATWQEEGVIDYLGTNDNVASIIALSDCVVLPSYREGLSRVLLEASSMAKPIITTDVPGCSCLVDDGVNGFLCAVKDPVDLALKMEKMLQLDKDHQLAMGQEGRNKVINEYDSNIVINQYKKSVENILNK